MEKTSPKDVFIHLLAMIGLYISAASFLVLVFQFINIIFPDRLDQYSLPGNYGAIRWGIASLIVVFPSYLAATWFLRRGYRLNPATRELRTRKWLVYFTLFVVAVVILGDIVALIYTFLNGDLTVRFALKGLAILIVAAAAFGYYFFDMRRTDESLRSSAPKMFAGVTGLLVAAAIVGGFFVVGSPQQERVRRFDERRIQDLQIVQSEIINYWRLKEKLPASVDALRDDIRGFVPPRDPQTDAPYEYAVKSIEGFELCAIFVFSNGGLSGIAPPHAYLAYPEPYYGKGSWDHGVGRTCFERKIDRELYPPERKNPKL